MEQFLGIEIGGTKLQLVRGDNQGRILERCKLKVLPQNGAHGIRIQIAEALPALAKNIAGIGVGFGGPVDWKTGCICRSHQIEGWSNFDLAGWMGRQAHTQVFVENDANVATLGEAIHGAGQGYDPVFYITLGSGVGGGLVVNGLTYHGAMPGEAEIGHVQLDRCGAIVESRCSGWAIDRRIKELVNSGQTGLLAQLAREQPGAEARHLGIALQQGDPAAARLLQELAGDLAFALSHVVHLFHPQIIIIGGGLSGLREPLRAAVEGALTGFVMDAFAPGPRVAIAGLGEDAVPVGALTLAAKNAGQTLR
jgi:glucokinase